MTRETALLQGRAAAEAGMVDTCTVKHGTGSTTDDTTGAVTPTYSTVYTGPCKIQGAPVASRRNVGEASVVVASVLLHLPIVGSEPVAVEDIATINTSGMDTALVGKVFRVAGPADGTFKTARRFPVVEVTS